MAQVVSGDTRAHKRVFLCTRQGVTSSKGDLWPQNSPSALPAKASTLLSTGICLNRAVN